MATEGIEPPATVYISDLDASLPDGSLDEVRILDNHSRGIKNVLKLTFPNITGAVTKTQAELNAIMLHVADKSAAVLIAPVAGYHMYIDSADGRGNIWRSVVGASPGTYADDNASFCGTVFIPTGGDGSAAWLRDYKGSVSAVWFGLATGVTNTAIQDAVTAHSDVELPEGIFPITATIAPPIGTRLKGCGENTLIQVNANISAITLDGVDDVVLKEFKIDGLSATYTTDSNNGIYSPANGTGSNDITIEDVIVFNVAGAGIIFLAQTGSHSTNIKIRSNTIINTGTHGIICQDYVDRTDISFNYVRYFGLSTSDRPGITTGRYADNHQVNNNRVIGSGSALGTSVHGISLDNGTNFTCNNNNVKNVIGYGIELGGAQNATCGLNTIADTTRAAIAIAGTTILESTDFSIIGNTIDSSAAQGIYVYNGSGVLTENGTISGNKIKNSGTIGIHLDDACSTITITGNNIKGCAQSGVYCNLSNVITLIGNTIIGNNTSSSGSHSGVRIINTAAETSYLIEPNQVLSNGSSDFAVDNPILNNGLATKPTSTVFTAGDTTPSIAFGDTFKTGGIVSYTFFDGSRGEGDSFKLLALHAATLINGTFLKTSTGINKTLVVNSLYTFTMIGGVWYESATV